MRTRQKFGWLDRFRFIAALLAITIHTSPLASINEGADFFLTRVLGRIAVPFFLMVTGQFVAAEFMPPTSSNAPKLIKYLRKTSLLYVFCILLYLPIGIYAKHYQGIGLGTALRMLIFDGTFYHLWYFPACIMGMLLIYLMSRKLSLRVMTILTSILYVIGLFGDSYYGLTQKVPALDAVYTAGFQIFSYTRNGIFMAPLFLVLGIWMAKSEKDHRSIGLPISMSGLAISFAAMTAEAFTLRHFQLQRHDSMYVALIPTMFFLYHCLMALPKESSKTYRTVSAWIYILHPAFIVVIRAVAKLLHLTELFVDNSLVHYLAVSFLSVIAAFVITYLWGRRIPKLRETPTASRTSAPKTRTSVTYDLRNDNEPETYLQENAHTPDHTQEMNDHMNFDSQWDAAPDFSNLRETEQENVRGIVSPTSRAWIELNTSALEHNVTFLRSRLPNHCRLMPAVKADAYGHGAILISRLLNQMGVDAFCVACLSEGIALREAGIKGEILILGYTAPSDLPLLVQYHLTQTIVDFSYAQMLEQSGQTCHVHLAVDTGMHRLGIRCENIEEILAVYQMQHLIIDGLFTHLSASDSQQPQDRAFTEGQVQAFYQVVWILEKQGIPCKGLHLLASYGMLHLLSDLQQNVPPSSGSDTIPPSAYAADYVRPGIALFGVLSTKEDCEQWEDFLQPVLSLKTRVASVRTLYQGEAAGYGLAYTANHDMQIATISIGYADGLPRELSHGKGSVLIDGYRAPIIGRICMDQTIVDVSNIPHVNTGDVAVIIGKSGAKENTAGQLAAQCNTITNELLSRLGTRLERITSP